MKKCVTALIVALLICSSFAWSNSYDSTTERIIMNVNLEEGWNLIQTYMGTPLSTSEITAQDIQAIYMYSPDLNDYIQLFPKGDADKFEKAQQIDRDYYNTYVNWKAFWVYSSKKGVLSYEIDIDGNYNKPSDLSLRTGYNFIAINSEMVGKTLLDVKGNCNWSKLLMFGNTGTESAWVDLINNADFNIAKEKFSASDVGKGIVIKVSNSCKLQFSGNPISAPPAIPN